MGRGAELMKALCFAAVLALAGLSGAEAKGGGGGGGGGHGGGGGGHGGGGGFHGGGFHGGGGHGFHAGRGGFHGGGGAHALRFGGRHGGGHAFRFAGGRPHGGGFHPGGRHFAGAGGGFAARGAAHFRNAGFGMHAPNARFTTGTVSVHGARGAPFAGAGLATRLFARPAFRSAVWPGPFFWWWAADDVFWPSAYDDVFWTYGEGDILTGALEPRYYPAYGAAAPWRGVRERRASRGAPVPGAAAPCSDQPTDPADLAGVEAELNPNPEQARLLDDLKAAEAKAADLLRADCPSAVPPTPTARLDALAQRFSRLIDAVRAVRPPLEALYAALDDEQKARFLTLNSGRRDASTRWLARCRSSQGAAASLPMDGLARELKLSSDQLGALDDLARASDDAAKAVADSCPSEVPFTPTARLAAIETRLTALSQAVDLLRPALARFYASLSDAQKARFDALGVRQSRRAG